MKKIKIVHWDDDKDEGTNLKVIIKRAFGDQNVDYEFINASFDDFEQTLINKKLHFDLLILDLLDENEKVVGTRILKQLLPDDKVIVLTGGGGKRIVQQMLNDPLIIVPYKKIYKSDLLINSHLLIPIIEELTELKCINNISVKIEWDKNDINADYQVSLIKEEHLANLISTFLNYRKFNHLLQEPVRIIPLASGYSGALVFQVVFSFKLSGSINILLKADRIKSNLELELKSAIGGKYYQIDIDYKLTYYPEILTSEMNGSCCYALTSDFIIDGETLKHKILKPERCDEKLAEKCEIKLTDQCEEKVAVKCEKVITKKYEEIEELLTTLFKKCLTDVYQTTIQKSDTNLIYPIKDIMVVIDKRKKAYLLNTVDELSLLSDEINISKINDILNFPNSEKSIGINESRLYHKIVLVHGDLHGNNIMVSRNGLLKIIDPANMNYNHWSRDLCMFIVDLFAYGIDNGNKQYFGITRIKDWRNIGNSLFEGKAIENGDKNKIVCQVLSSLSSQQYLENDLGFKHWFEPWEFQLSLVVEFLRASYKSNQLPAGKRAACMLIAIDGFEKAKKSFDTFAKSKSK